jgi:[ribosomal protein S5]-alanine N-acetyltransferase
MKMSLNIQLKELNQKLVSDKYINWMNDYEITKLTEQKYFKHTKKSTIKFVNEKKKSKNEYLFGIFYVNKNKTHIGNIKLGPINNYHKFAEISYLIGDINFQNRGIATEAIKQILILAKKKHKLIKIVATLYSNNHASRKVLEKNKFKLEGIIKKKFFFNKKRLDQLVFGRLI